MKAELTAIVEVKVVARLAMAIMDVIHAEAALIRSAGVQPVTPVRWQGPLGLLINEGNELILQ